MSMICMLISASFSAHAVVVDATTAGNWKGYMNVFENDNGLKLVHANLVVNGELPSLEQMPKRGILPY